MLRGLLVLLPALAGAQPSSPIGDFEGASDVGAARRPGSATYDARRQEYVLAAPAGGVKDAKDGARVVWKRLAGDFILTASARALGGTGGTLGWTVRPLLAADAPRVSAAAPAGDGVVQLERRGGAWLRSVARFGDTLVTERLADAPLGDTVYVGLFVQGDGARAAFRNVRVTIPARPDVPANRQTLGGHLEILDVQTGDRAVVHRSPQWLQAPNWTPDGKALIYNERGLLYRFDLATRTPSQIETGFATRNNNDHVLSFDGRTLGISHHPPEPGNPSIVYTVPAGGGTPTRVTPLGPSYLHGWSPDGRYLVYTGQRNGEFDIYRIPAAGGEEVRLTDAPGLDDGPEYSPDGRWIYFNSVRSGTMQLWRMRPDGSAPEQLTDDGFHNWFPHVSPDGRWVAFLSFMRDVAASDHPPYKHVYLRLMPANGGPARVIAYVYGGQGTINVPSWAPDSRRLAFVSNTAMP